MNFTIRTGTADDLMEWMRTAWIGMLQSDWARLVVNFGGDRGMVIAAPGGYAVFASDTRIAAGEKTNRVVAVATCAAGGEIGDGHPGVVGFWTADSTCLPAGKAVFERCLELLATDGMVRFDQVHEDDARVVACLSKVDRDRINGLLFVGKT